jgi:hypothetical protein
MDTAISYDPVLKKIHANLTHPEIINPDRKFLEKFNLTYYLEAQTIGLQKTMQQISFPFVFMLAEPPYFKGEEVFETVPYVYKDLNIKSVRFHSFMSKPAVDPQNLPIKMVFACKLPVE